MPKSSADTTDKVLDLPVVLDRSSDLDGYTVSFVSIRETQDLGPMLAPLPGGHCSCPHWGYLTSGRMTVRFGDREEVYEAGDAFYMPPGHVPTAEKGTDLVMFSPTDEFAATDAAITAGMEAASNA
jgi:mannose-6-phosphate isomerase-like protein (cupin superfamily)